MNFEQAKYLAETEDFSNVSAEEARFILNNLEEEISQAGKQELEQIINGPQDYK